MASIHFDLTAMQEAKILVGHTFLRCIVDIGKL